MSLHSFNFFAKTVYVYAINFWKLEIEIDDKPR